MKDYRNHLAPSMKDQAKGHFETLSLKEESQNVLPLLNQNNNGSGAHSVSGTSHKTFSHRKGSHILAAESMMHQNSNLLANNNNFEKDHRSRSLVKGLEHNKSR